MAISNTIDVAAEPDAAWAKLADLDNAGDWNTLHVAYVGGNPGEAKSGKAFREQISMMGMPAEVDWIIETADAPSRLVMKGMGPMNTALTATFTVTPGDGGGSTVGYETEFEGAAVVTMQGPLEAASKKAGDASLEKLKALLG
jgi:carbon monoxide dehydrogenase subunit G